MFDKTCHFHMPQVSRQMRKAFRSSVSIDPASAANLVALSESGAAVTGIPRDTVRALRRRQAGPSTASQNNKGSPLPEDYLRTLALMLTGSNLENGTQPWASCYGGHQFGTWVGQLGDGRVATLGDIRVPACSEDCAAVARLWRGELIEVCFCLLLNNVVHLSHATSTGFIKKKAERRVVRHQEGSMFLSNSVRILMFFHEVVEG